MNQRPPSDRSVGISRRDFVLGKVWKIPDELPADADTADSGTADSGTADSGTDSTSRDAPPVGQAARPTVMRYPKSLEDVAAAAPPNQFPAGAAAARRRHVPVLRPPGAIDEAGFLAGCTRCGECLQACPHQAIVPAPERLREAAGTPMIDADRQPCLMCSDFPCIAVCEPGVLTHRVPKMMGTARITEHLCVAHHGSICTVCADHCPVERVIVFRQEKPTIDESRCTGCGVCRAVCTAPENAILLMPTFLRPPVRSE